MGKTEIKKVLRESLASVLANNKSGAIKETQPTPTQDAPPAEGNNSNKRTEKDYSEIQAKLSNTMLKQNQVMAAAGLGDPKNATDRSLFSKKVHKEKNDEGGVYQFDDKELASVIKVLNNPASYLNVKNK